MSAVSTRAATIKSDLSRWARVFSLAPDSEESTAFARRQYKNTLTAKDLGEYYIHTVIGR